MSIIAIICDPVLDVHDNMAMRIECVVMDVVIVLIGTDDVVLCVGFGCHELVRDEFVSSQSQKCFRFYL